MSRLDFVTVTHDPDKRLLKAMGDTLGPLFAKFGGVYVVLSQRTHPDVEAALRGMGVDTERERKPAVGASRRQALAMARQAGSTHCLYCDLDRALHWARDYPSELAQTLARVSESDLLVIGRTARAFASHPRCMTETEGAANHVFGLTFRREWDICAAARGISTAAADAILAESRVDGVGTEGEWPALLLKREGLRFDYVETEGMEYETPDRFPDEVRAAGGAEAWTEAVAQSPAD
ncbi:MAG: hypothetical protein M0Z94_18030, partial [Dehalococcoidales bacterium]|nr:hypothetical protein [Dehalococcoidales bacterium]